MPPAAAEAASKAVAAALRKGKPKHGSAGSAGLADEQQLQEDGERVQGPGKQQEQQAADAGAVQSAPEQRGAVHTRASEGALPAASEASEGGKVKSTKPPPGFESVNGVLKASTRAKKVGLWISFSFVAGD